MIFNKNKNKNDDTNITKNTGEEFNTIPNQGLKYGLYSFYDVCSQTFGNPFVCQNDDVAMREKRAFCMLPQNQYLANDLRLYRLGMFAPMTGEIVGDIVLLVEKDDSSLDAFEELRVRE